jgi:hypothetical protein
MLSGSLKFIVLKYVKQGDHRKVTSQKLTHVLVVLVVVGIALKVRRREEQQS